MADVLSKFVYGIYVLGSSAGGQINAMIASWVSQVSGTPPIVAVAVRRDRHSHKFLAEGSAFTLALLGKDQLDEMPRFKGAKEITEGHINGIPYVLAENGAPVPAECVGYIEAEIETSIEVGDHTIFMGRVTREVEASGGETLSTADLVEYAYTG